MAKFFIHHTVKISDDFAEFYVEFLESQIQANDEFSTYETHHKITWKVVAVKPAEDKFILLCSTQHGLGYENQFVGALVDTKGATRLELFSYDHLRAQRLYDPNSVIHTQAQRLKGQYIDRG